MNIMKRVVTAGNEKIATLITEKKQLKSTLRRNNSQRTYNNIISSIHRKLQTMETSIRNRHKRKLQRDNVNAVIAGKNQRKNRRFSRNQLERKKREKKKRNKCSFKERIKKIKENSPDQNTINLPTRDLTPSQKISFSKSAYICTYTNKC